jgi:hypothetical protein
MTGKAEADVVIRYGKVIHPPDTTGLKRYTPSNAEEIHLFWKEGGTFLVRKGREIIIDPAPQATEETLRLLIMGPVLGILLHQRGFFVLHASAVLMNGGVVAFLGKRGWGKSTMAAALHVRGYNIVTDDMLVLDMEHKKNPIILPSIPCLKLWPDSVASLKKDPETLPRVHSKFRKCVMVTDNVIKTSPQLKKIFILGGGSVLEINSIKAQEAFTELVRHSYAFQFLGSEGVTSMHFFQCVEITKNVSICRLRRPFSLHMLPDIARFVEKDLYEKCD